MRAFNREQETQGPSPEASPALDDGARAKIAALPNVAEAYPDIRFITEFRFEDKAHLTMVAGLAFSSKDSDGFENMRGRFFASDAAQEVVIQKSFAAELLGKPATRNSDEINVAEVAKPLLGKQIVMRYGERQASGPGADAAGFSVISRELPLTIVGVTDLDPDSMRGAARARIFVPEKLIESLHAMQAYNLRDSSGAAAGQPEYSTVIARVSSAGKVDSVEQGIKKLGFNTFSILDASKGLQTFFRIVDSFLLIFGSLALTVACIGIVNTLVMAILERRREIGIMKAIGASDGDLRGLFFAEAGAMGLLGGAFGTALGWLIGRAINIGTNIYFKRLGIAPEKILAVPWWLVALAIGLALVVSLISGLYPASRAAKLDPVQALRYE